MDKILFLFIAFNCVLMPNKKPSPYQQRFLFYNDIFHAIYGSLQIPYIELKFMIPYQAAAHRAAAICIPSFCNL